MSRNNSTSSEAGGQPKLVSNHHMTPRSRTISWIVGILALIALVAFAVHLSHGSGGQQGQSGGGGRPGASGGRGGGRFSGPGGMAPPTTVGTAKATQADIPLQIESLGTVTPEAVVTVRPQVSGTITQLLYREGQLVHKGDVLAIIDPRPYEAALLQAQGALQRDQAQLENAKVQLARYDTLLTQDSIARQDRDTQAALVNQLEGTVVVDRGSLQQAQINLGFTKVVSPVSGRAGLKVIDVGNFIGAGDSNGIVVVTMLQPIDVEFTITQQQQPQIQQRVAQGAQLPAVALDSTRTQTLDSGVFSTLNNQVDTSTGTIKGKARFANDKFQLFPSQFVNVRLTVDTVHNAVTVPPNAVQSGPNGQFVWLLNNDRTVTQRPVKLGATVSDKTQITDGLALGETVVTDGADRLTDGATVALPGDAPAMPKEGEGKANGRRRGGAGGRRGGSQGG
jgi:multidrug efflux system membrane fusion protein